MTKLGTQDESDKGSSSRLEAGLSKPRSGDEDAAPRSDADRLEAGASDEDMDGGEVEWEDAEYEDPKRLAAMRRKVMLSLLFTTAVVVIAVAMMVSMWEDARFFLYSDDKPEEIQLADYVEQNSDLQDLSNRYVKLFATPDQSTAVKVALGKNGVVTQRYRYMRMLEARNRMFVQTGLPVAEESEMMVLPGLNTRKLQGSFSGRVHRLSKLAFFRDLRAHYDALASVEVYPIPKDDWAKLGAKNGQSGAGLELRVKDDEQNKVVSTVVEQEDLFEVVLDPGAWMLQMGTKTWPTVEDATQAVQALGVPYFHVVPQRSAKSKEETLHLAAPNKLLYHTFWIRPASQSLESIKSELEKGRGVPLDHRSLELGAAVIERTRTFLVRPGDLAVDGSKLRFEAIARTAIPGFSVQEQKLVPWEWGEEGLVVSLDQVVELRLRRPVWVDEKSVILLDGSKPSEHWPFALGFVMLIGLAVVNLGMSVRLGRRWQVLSQIPGEAG